LLQILYQLSMIWIPNMKQDVPRHVFWYYQSLQVVKDTGWVVAIHEATSKESSMPSKPWREELLVRGKKNDSGDMYGCASR